jgi:hypothetical protein
MVGLVPSLAVAAQLPTTLVDTVLDSVHLFPVIMRMLTDLAWMRPILLVLDDLHNADSTTLNLLHYLARLAVQRRWLVVGTYNEEDAATKSELFRVLVATSDEAEYRAVTRLGQAVEATAESLTNLETWASGLAGEY